MQPAQMTPVEQGYAQRLASTTDELLRAQVQLSEALGELGKLQQEHAKCAEAPEPTGE